MTRVASTDGVQVAVFDLAGEADAVPLLISHATGFHGHSYLPLAEALSSRFRSIAFDYRGHGDTAQPEGVGVDWNRYTDDVEAVALTLPNPLVAFGHSMGGACLLMAAHRHPHLFSHLVIYEPVVFPPQRPTEGPGQLVSSTRRRRSTFESYSAAMANFSSKPPLDVFTPAALEAYVKYGFAQDDDGRVHLKCSPELEATTYEMNTSHSTWELLPEIDVPVLVLCGRPDPGSVADFSQRVAERLPNGTFKQLDELDHFGPMTHPELIAQLIDDAL